MQQSKKYGIMKNRLKTEKKKPSNPVAKAMLVSNEVNTKPKVVKNKKKYNRGKEKREWQSKI